ncbi:alpha/beta-hydrolase [Panus rudis PR-1116 ss-1]|nr:alpha/beta-hydrolase [Panus rudis PR-1116 ss-1]
MSLDILLKPWTSISARFSVLSQYASQLLVRKVLLGFQLKVVRMTSRVSRTKAALSLSVAAVLSFASLTQAIPASGVRTQRDTDAIDNSTTPLTQSQIDSFTPYTWYAAAVGCNPNATLTWTCGPRCDANPDFQPVATGGDGIVTQFWFVGFDPKLNTVVVSHQATDPSKVIPVLTDLDFIPVPVDPSLFPGLPNDILVHMGFAGTQGRSAPGVLEAVETALTKFGTTHVTIVGASLGAAIALLDSVYLPLHLPNSTTFSTIVYGLPRVGNQAFADYVDAHATSLTHINNKKDPVPTLPPDFLGFRHPSGEVHIEEDGSWIACAGQENPSPLCEKGLVPSYFAGNNSDHEGPYGGVLLDACDA